GGGSRSETKVAGIADTVLAYLSDHPNTSKNGIEKAVGGRAEHVRKALDMLVSRGDVTRLKSGSAFLHRLTSSPSSHLVPDERTNPSRHLVPSSIGRGRGRGDQETQLSMSSRDEHTDVDGCRRCGLIPDDRAGLGSGGLCVACELTGVAS